MCARAPSSISALFPFGTACRRIPAVLSIWMLLSGIMGASNSLMLPFLRSMVVCEELRDSSATATIPAATDDTRLWSGSDQCADREHVIGHAQAMEGRLLTVRLVASTMSVPVLSAYADRSAP